MADNEKKAREALLEHLERRSARFRAHSRRNDRATTGCYLVAIIGSLAATLCAAVGSLPHWVDAVITAVPATALLANSVFAFELKSRWHRRRKAKYDDYILRLRFEACSPSTISAELREFEDKLDADYPRFGSLGGKAAKAD